MSKPTHECPREAEVFEAVAFNRVDEVRAHLDECAVCAEIALVAGAVHDDHAAACRNAQVPTAAIVWWRATIRARAEAARTVSQPITLLQGVAGACALGLVAALVTIFWPSLGWLPSTELLARLSEVRADATVSTVVQYALPLMLGLAACLVIAPLAVYVALSDE